MLPGVFSGASREVRVRRVISAQWLDCAVDTRRDVSLTQVAVRARSCVLRVHHQIVGPRLIDYGRPTSAIGRTRHFGLRALEDAAGRRRRREQVDRKTGGTYNIL